MVEVEEGRILSRVLGGVETGGREKLADYRGTAKKVYPLDRGKRTRTPGCEIKKHRKRPKKI